MGDNPQNVKQLSTACGGPLTYNYNTRCLCSCVFIDLKQQNIKGMTSLRVKPIKATILEELADGCLLEIGSGKTAIQMAEANKNMSTFVAVTDSKTFGVYVLTYKV